MKYIDYIKAYDKVDKFILFLLWLDIFETIDEVAAACEVTRQTVYNVIDRNKKLIEDYIGSVDEILKDKDIDETKTT